MPPLPGRGSIARKRLEKDARQNEDDIRQEFGLSNFKSKRLSRAVFAEADKEVSVKHQLGLVPEGFLLINLDKEAIVWDSGRPWTNNNIYLKSNTAGLRATFYIVA